MNMRHKTQQFALQLRRPIQYINPALTRDVARHLYALQDEVDRLTERSAKHVAEIETSERCVKFWNNLHTSALKQVEDEKAKAKHSANSNFIGGLVVGFAVGLVISVIVISVIN